MVLGPCVTAHVQVLGRGRQGEVQRNAFIAIGQPFKTQPREPPSFTLFSSIAFVLSLHLKAGSNRGMTQNAMATIESFFPITRDKHGFQRYE